MKSVKEVLEDRGYKFPKFKDRKESVRFVAKHGYDPAILLNAARRAKDGAGPGWENAFPVRKRKRGRPPKKKE